MRKLNYKQNNIDHTLFIKQKPGKVTVFIVYVDDMVVITNDSSEIKTLQRQLAIEFELKDLGNLNYFLGLKLQDQLRKFLFANGSM